MPDAVAVDGTCTNCVAVLPQRRRGGNLFNLVHDVWTAASCDAVWTTAASRVQM